MNAPDSIRQAPWSSLLSVGLFVPVAIGIVLVVTRAWTWLAFQRALGHFDHAKDNRPRSPPQVPYTIPWLGHALDFVDLSPGQYWRQLLRSIPAGLPACTVMMGGQKLHFVFDQVAISQLVKNKGVSRDKFNDQVAVQAFGISETEKQCYYAHGEDIDEELGMTAFHYCGEHMLHEYLLRNESVNGLTDKFLEIFTGGLDAEFSPVTSRDVNIHGLLRSLMFQASCTTLMGSRVLEIDPNFERKYFEAEWHIMHLFLGFPRLLAPKSYAARDTATQILRKVGDANRASTNNTVVDPAGPVVWEPNWGSRFNRARQDYYNKRDLSHSARAKLDLGILFGLESNANHAASWMIMHILDPSARDPTVLPRVMTEVKSAQNTDGSIDMLKLCNLPLCQSIFYEVLRMYNDTLITRVNPAEDVVLSLSNSKTRILIKKGETVVVPSWPIHYDEKFWSSFSNADVNEENSFSVPDASTFYAERFLSGTEDEPFFSTNGTAGRWIAFGGGKGTCPGRVFAKQSVLACVALTLLRFDIEVLGFVDTELYDTQKVLGKREAFPRPRYGQLPGSTVLIPDSDIRVKMTPKKLA